MPKMWNFWTFIATKINIFNYSCLGLYNLSFFIVYRKNAGGGVLIKRSFPSSPKPGILTEAAWRCMGIFLTLDCLMPKQVRTFSGSFCGANLSSWEYLWSPNTGQLRASPKCTRSWCLMPVSGSSSTSATPPDDLLTFHETKIKVGNKNHIVT